MNRCPYCDQRLTFDQSFTDSRPDGHGPLGTELRFTVTVMACRECGYTQEEITE